MRLYRLVPEGGLWLRARALAEASPDSILPAVVPFFVPSPGDKEWPSLFAIQDADEADFVAAALRYNEGKIEACHFAGVDSRDLDAAKIAWRKTSGQTYHPVANDRHYEMHIPDIKALWAAVKLFAAGSYVNVEHARVRTTLEKSAAEGHINLDAVLDKINGNVATRTLELVKSKHLILKAAAAAA